MKQNEIKNLSTADLQEKLVEFTNQYEELRSAHAIAPVANPLQLRSLRRTIARVKTQLSKENLQ